MTRRFAVLTLLALCLAPPPLAGQQLRDDRGRAATPQGDVQPLGAIMQRLRPRVTGRLLDADLLRGDGRPVYSIRILGEDGRVRVLTVDARSGEIISGRP